MRSMRSISSHFDCNGMKGEGMALEALPEVVEDLSEPIYRPFRLASELLRPGQSVLDVGCGNGKVGAYLSRTAGVTVDGIEPTLSRATVAAERLRNVSSMPAGHDDPVLERAYDAVTFFDVLEHLVDPSSALTWAVSRLKPDGVIIAAIPNSANLHFRLKVLRGDWEMSDGGLFDRTHLRFFDIRTMHQLRPEGTELARVEYTVSPHSHWGERKLVNLLPNLMAMHGVFVWSKT
jgi:2-polyprenyl-3-methyl-5-hydroxy-6-metoxy-1,4-benzoquinol methylase